MRAKNVPIDLGIKQGLFILRIVADGGKLSNLFTTWVLLLLPALLNI